MTVSAFVTDGGVRIERRETPADYATALDTVLAAVDTRRGAVLTSAYEYPGRYKRWSLGFVDPPLEVACTGRSFTVTALNARGQVLVAALAAPLAAHPHLRGVAATAESITGQVIEPEPGFPEEERSRQPTAFSLVRAVLAAFHSEADPHLGLYGAFGFDLVHQFEPREDLKPRPADQRDVVLYLPDRLVVVDAYAQRAFAIEYDFAFDGKATAGLARTGSDVDPRGARLTPATPADRPPGGYAAVARSALDWFARGDLFEAVPGESFYEPCTALPSVLFDALRRINPSPYGFLFNLGGEYLIGASPEMFVRVEGRRIETCPISGTIARGRDAIEDAQRIRELLNSTKDESELTMCTDVDRNDKARVCVPGTVKVIGRRQIEMYSHLIHTVDHVEGLLRPDCDALDGFLTHCWAVTVTGAPKRAAIGFVEANELSPRRWYGGAVGWLGFDGNLNTGLTLRTIRLKDSIAELRVGATLLHDSDPEAEEREIHLKAAALRKALAAAAAGKPAAAAPAAQAPVTAARPRVLMVDCEDSFVLTLADYLRQAGADLVTLRHDAALPRLREGWDLVVFSPGPGRPAQFRVPEMVLRCADQRLPVFGVCLGLQGIVEAFGGRLGQLPEPCHGKSSEIRVNAEDSRLFRGLGARFAIGRYHSLYAERASLPAALRVTAETLDGLVMAVEHRRLPIAAVQFHPESIMSLDGGAGHAIIRNVMETLARAREETVAG